MCKRGDDGENEKRKYGHKPVKLLYLINIYELWIK